MLNLDAKSVLAVFSLITFLFALLIYFYGRQNKSTFLGFRSLGTGLIILWLALTVNVIGETLNINSYRFISYPLKMVAFLYIYWGFAEFKKVKKNVAIEVVILFVFISLLFSAFHYHHHYHFFISFLSVYIMFYSFRIAYMLFKNIPLYNVFLNSALASLFLVYAFFNIIFISFINFSNYLSNFDDQRLIFALVTTMLEVLFITVYLMLINKEIVYIKDRFLSILAHEIKNPLNNIMGFSQLSMSKTNLEELNHFQNMIYVSARNGFELLTNLLEWSKNQLGKVNVHIRPFKIVELVNEINAFNDILVKNKKIKLVVAVHQDFEMLADRQLIGVVLNNLISNAIKFTSEEIQKFKIQKTFGVPMKNLKAYLALPVDEQDKILKDYGIPTDSLDNQFKSWIKNARATNGDLRIAIKADQSTPYKVIKSVMNSLQDLRENRYNLITSLKVTSDK